MTRPGRRLRRHARPAAWLLAVAAVLGAWQRSRTWTDSVGYTAADATRYAAATFPGGLAVGRGPETPAVDDPRPTPAGWHVESRRQADAAAAATPVCLACAMNVWAVTNGPPVPPLSPPRLEPGPYAPRYGFAGLGWSVPDPPPAALQAPWLIPLVGRPFAGVAVPFWLPLAGLAAVPPAWLVQARRRAARAGCCTACGYDLRASPGRCPECGAVPT